LPINAFYSSRIKFVDLVFINVMLTQCTIFKAIVSATERTPLTTVTTIVSPVRFERYSSLHRSVDWVVTLVKKRPFLRLYIHWFAHSVLLFSCIWKSVVFMNTFLKEMKSNITYILIDLKPMTVLLSTKWPFLVY